MTIFRYKNENDDYLLINFSYLESNKIEKINDCIILKNDEKIVGINIFNLTDFVTNEVGFLYPDSNLINWIKNKTNMHNLIFDVDIVVGFVKQCDPIDNTHLHKCIVFDGNEDHELICGANNIKQDIKVVISRNNAILPNGMQIKPRKIGNLISKSMLCSKKELGLAQESNGIIVLDDSYVVGSPYMEIYKNVLK